jgi:enoyl-CoA hydratase/carnithine racemase
MDFQYIKTEREDSTFIVTLNRPEKLNALSPELSGEVVRGYYYGRYKGFRGGR